MLCGEGTFFFKLYNLSLIVGESCTSVPGGKAALPASHMQGTHGDEELPVITGKNCEAELQISLRNFNFFS